MITEDKETMVNLKRIAYISIVPMDGKYAVGIPHGYGELMVLKSFIYKEDAVRYLHDMLMKLDGDE